MLNWHCDKTSILAPPNQTHRNKTVVTVDKTDEVEDQNVSPQFRFEGYVRNIIKYNIKYTHIMR